MIKSLLEPDEKRPEEIKIEREEKTPDDSAIDENFESHFAQIESSPALDEPENLREISEPADDELIVSEKPEVQSSIEYSEDESSEIRNPHFYQSEDLPDEEDAAMEKIFADFQDDEINVESPEHDKINQSEVNQSAAEKTHEISDEPPKAPPPEIKAETPKYENPGLLYQPPAEKESFAETARKSGLAYAAAITLFGSVIFMLVIGWFADLLFGSSPWGIVGGIVLGAAIGFFQFFRMTAQIFRDRD